MSIAPLVFTGVSTYSTDLQTVLSRAVQIAQLPLTALQNTDSDTLAKKSLLGGMTAPLTSLGDAVAALGTLASKKAVSASSSDTTKVKVVNTGADSPGVHTISNITSVAKAAGERSLVSYADSSATAVSTSGSMRLVVGSTNYDFSVTNKNNLIGLRDKINAQGAGVTASILTTGASTNYLSVVSNSTGATTLKLLDDPGVAGERNILTQAAAQGSNAEFMLDNIPISRTTNTVSDIISGMSFTILDTAPTGTVSLTLATDSSQLSSAIQDFATKYNAMVDQVNAQVGPSAGLLSGDFLVREIQTDMRSLGNYQASGTIKSLSDVGLNFDTSGKITFDSALFNKLSDTQITGAFQFFGSATTGFGQLAKNFQQLTDPVTGLIKIQNDSYDAADKRIQNSISDMTDRINTMQKGLASRLQIADSLLAQLASQQSLITASIQSVTYALYGKSTS